MGHFLPFYSNENPENQNFEKMKQTPGDIILHMCTINDNHMMYDFWDREHRIFCQFGPFLPFDHSDNLENQNFENMKQTPRDKIWHLCTKNHYHMMYASQDMVSNRQKFLSFWVIFSLLHLWQCRKSKFWKNEANTQIYHFTLVYYKGQSYDVWFLSYGARHRICQFGSFLALLPPE